MNLKIFQNSWFSILLLLIACGPSKSHKSSRNDSPSRLPFFGEPSILSREENGVLIIDTVYPTIPNFSFRNQEGKLITQEDIKGKIYVADFFFTTCPTICPIMKSQMLRVYETFLNEPRLVILSHSIDPEHDSVSVLKEYADRLQVAAPRWNFLTGNKDSIYTLAEAYMASAAEDPTAPGGFIHSGAFILIDHNRFIRGYYDGTKPEEVDQLIKDIPILLREVSEP
ncbi:MAG: SCO family protein [Flavobacteriales bacterium]|nr:SCO family protein [Flavobacteriales bacterium]